MGELCIDGTSFDVFFFFFPLNIFLPSSTNQWAINVIFDLDASSHAPLLKGTRIETTEKLISAKLLNASIHQLVTLTTCCLQYDFLLLLLLHGPNILYTVNYALKVKINLYWTHLRWYTKMM